MDVYAQLAAREGLLAALSSLSTLRPRDLCSEQELRARRTEAIGPTVRAEAKSLLRKLREKNTHAGAGCVEAA